MPFKIIETFEKGQKRLCVVPSLWERKGVLRWPKKRLEVNKLIKDENSRPSDNWSTSKCTTKRTLLPSYEEAISELNLMLQNSDTEIDTVTETYRKDNTSSNFNSLAGQLIVNQPRFCSSTVTTSAQVHSEDNTAVTETYRKDNTSSNFNSLAGQLIVNQPRKSCTSTVTSAQMHSEDNTAAQYLFQYLDESTLPTISVQEAHQNEFEAQTLQAELQTQNSTDVNQIETYLKLILDNQYNMAQTINAVIDNQKKIIHKLACLSVQIDDGFSKSGRTTDDVITLRESDPIHSKAFTIKPIDSVKELEEMESLLANKNLKLKLLKQYFFICSQSDGRGATCAYKILDMFFSREFLCKCSWTGGSRNSDEVKIGLRGYKNLLNFYYELIHSWDKTYTEENNENFFKIVLKNSNKRKLSKNLRASTKRMRTKKTGRKGNATNNSEQGNQDANQMDTNDTEQNENETNDSNQREMDAIEENMVEVNAAIDNEIIEEEEEQSLC